MNKSMSFVEIQYEKGSRLIAFILLCFVNDSLTIALCSTFSQYFSLPHNVDPSHICSMLSSQGQREASRGILQGNKNKNIYIVEIDLTIFFCFFRGVTPSHILL